MLVRTMQAADGAEVLAIYQAGLDSGHASFETAAPAWAQFDAAHLSAHRHVAVDADAVLGWVAVSPVSRRAVYAGVVEHSVYVHPDAGGRGVGRLLIESLIASTEEAGVWTIKAGVFPENVTSLALHRRCGFRVIGSHERLGLDRRTGQWRDVVLLERRSARIG